MIRQHPILATLTIVYMIVFSALALLRGNAEFLMYAASMVVFILVIIRMHGRVSFSSATLWGLWTWGLLHMAGGTVPVGVDQAGDLIVLYAWRPIQWLPKYDQVTHAFGFGVATLACFEAITAAFDARTTEARRTATTFGICTIAVLAGLGLGAVNEILEFFAVLTLPKTGVGGYINTGWDLVSNATGAVAMGAVIFARRRSRQPEPGAPATGPRNASGHPSS